MFKCLVSCHFLHTLTCEGSWGFKPGSKGGRESMGGGIKRVGCGIPKVAGTREIGPFFATFHNILQYSSKKRLEPLRKWPEKGVKCTGSRKFRSALACKTGVFWASERWIFHRVFIRRHLGFGKHWRLGASARRWRERESGRNPSPPPSSTRPNSPHFVNPRWWLNTRSQAHKPPALQARPASPNHLFASKKTEKFQYICKLKIV